MTRVVPSEQITLVNFVEEHLEGAEGCYTHHVDSISLEKAIEALMTPHVFKGLPSGQACVLLNHTHLFEHFQAFKWVSHGT